MNTHSPFALTSSRVFTPLGERPGSILVEDGMISGIVSPADVPSRFLTKDAGNAAVIPGLVDTHVHINEPGRTEWEGFETATKAAAAGGITTLIDMPLNSSPVTTTLDAFHRKREASSNKLFVDCGFYAGLIPGNANEIESLINAGVFGVKAFLTHSGIDDFPNATEKDLRAAMPVIARYGLPLLVHAELESAPIGSPSTTKYQEYLASRPRQWEHDAIELMIHLCREYQCRTHIVHLSSSDEAGMLLSARNSGLPVTVETCPHYLYFASEDIPDGATHYKCAPPVRERKNRELLWEALGAGTIDLIVSDHSPCPPDMKLLDTGDFMKAWGGISSLQLGLPIIWTEAEKRRFTITDVVRWMSSAPAALAGLQERKGSIAAGFDADIVVFHPEKSFIVSPSILHHRHSLTPYEGAVLNGTVVQTYLRGHLIYNGGSINEIPHGTLLLRR